jgi:hypothetical protein
VFWSPIGDGPSDGWDLLHGFDPPAAQIAPPDPDSDGFVNLYENISVSDD